MTSQRGIGLLASLAFLAALADTSPASAQSRQTVAVVAAGGTVAATRGLDAGAPALSEQNLVSAVPKLRELADLRVIEFSNVPSAYMGPDRWPSLSRVVDEALADPGITGAVLLHGTDTLDQTAYFLDLTLRSSKPVVAVGVQRDTVDPGADGPALLDAIRQVLAQNAPGKGVTVTADGRINAAREARQTRTSGPDAFGSGDAGVLGTVDEIGVVFQRAPLRRQTLPLPESLPRVDLVAMHAGADGGQIRHAADGGAEAIVVEAYGLGNVNEAVYDAIQYAISRGVAVIVATKAANGRALPLQDFKGGGKTLKDLGAVFAGDLPGDKACILAMLALSAVKQPAVRDQAALQAFFDK